LLTAFVAIIAAIHLLWRASIRYRPPVDVVSLILAAVKIE
jgi:hypothetical protein